VDQPSPEVGLAGNTSAAERPRFTGFSGLAKRARRARSPLSSPDSIAGLCRSNGTASRASTRSQSRCRSRGSLLLKKTHSAAPSAASKQNYRLTSKTTTVENRATPSKSGKVIVLPPRPLPHRVGRGVCEALPFPPHPARPDRRGEGREERLSGRARSRQTR